MEKLRRFNRDIPDLLLSEFRTRDLIQMKRVSKLWRVLISDRSFQLNHSLRQKPLLTGFFFQQKSPLLSYTFSHASYISAGREEQGAPLPKLLKHPLEFAPEHFVLTSSCNGLVCCKSSPLPESDSLTIHVGNPLTREWVEFDFNWSNGKAQAVILSFDPSNDITDGSTDFKVLVAWDGEDCWMPSLHLYSSKTKSWKFLDSDETYIMYEYYDPNRTEPVCVKGVMYWLAHATEMLVFDMGKELAYTVSTPLPVSEFIAVKPPRPPVVVCIGESADGELQYVMVSDEGIRVWDLEDAREGRWSLMYVKPLADIRNGFGDEFAVHNLQEAMRLQQLGEVRVDALGLKDGVLMLRVADYVFSYEVGSDRVDRIGHVTEFGGGGMFDPKVAPYLEVPKVVPYSMSLVPLNRP